MNFTFEMIAEFWLHKYLSTSLDSNTIVQVLILTIEMFSNHYLNMVLKQHSILDSLLLMIDGGYVMNSNEHEHRVSKNLYETNFKECFFLFTGERSFRFWAETSPSIDVSSEAWSPWSNVALVLVFGREFELVAVRRCTRSGSPNDLFEWDFANKRK